MHLLHRLRHLAEDAAVDVVCEFDRLPDRNADGDHADVHLVLPRQTQPHEDAGPKIDQVSVRARHVGVRIEHENIVGEYKAKVTVEAENLW